MKNTVSKVQLYSVLMSVYGKDSAEYLRVALRSVAEQSVPPNEIVLVEDGPLSNSLYSVIEECSKSYPQVVRVPLRENRGLGVALAEGILHCSYDLVARMDSDDICLPGRFEKQLRFMEEHPDVDISGGQISEFIDSPENVVSRRIVPEIHRDIARYMRSRCAMNHGTVMFRKSAVLKAGNYQDWFWNEDYYLWVRMLESGCRFANLPDLLVNMRTGRDQYSRRGGKRYYASEKGIQRYMLEHGIISNTQYLINISVRWCVQLGMPNWLRGWAFRIFFRK